MKQIISKISKDSIPSDSIQKSKKEIADSIYQLVEKEIKKYSEVIELEFGGSYAKGTWLSGVVGYLTFDLLPSMAMTVATSMRLPSPSATTGRNMVRRTN